MRVIGVGFPVVIVRVTGDLESTYLAERAVELATLTEPGLRDEIAARGVTLASYRDWRAAGNGSI